MDDESGTGEEPVYLILEDVVIERELTVMAELEAIVEDYLEQSATWDVIPAAGCRQFVSSSMPR